MKDRPEVAASFTETINAPGISYAFEGRYILVKGNKLYYERHVRFADSEGWGWGAFDYEAASDTLTPATEKDTPPQQHDAKCGFACHTAVMGRDYVFTDYGKR